MKTIIIFLLINFSLLSQKNDSLFIFINNDSILKNSFYLSDYKEFTLGQRDGVNSYSFNIIDSANVNLIDYMVSEDEKLKKNILKFNGSLSFKHYNYITLNDLKI